MYSFILSVTWNDLETHELRVFISPRDNVTDVESQTILP